MKKIPALSVLVFLLIQPLSSQYLKVSDGGKYIARSDGRPFLWIGDTAWELFHKLNRGEANEYLENRAEKGFTVIQAVVLAENDGLRTPNPYGDVPFTDLDPTKPNEAYFQHVDYIVNKAEELGLYVGMLPTWGDKIYSANPGAGPIVFNPENAGIFGKYLGTRYKDKPIIWILGGDRNIANMEVLEIWRAMAEGIQEGDKGNHLITYHPRGSSMSSYWLHNEPWLDMNMYQSGHSNRFNKVYEYAETLALLQPVKPFIDGEPAYEDIPVVFWEFMDFSKPDRQRVPNGVLDEQGLIKNKAHFEKGFFTAYDVRIHAYWDFLSGACGYTYGNNAIWQMFKLNGSIAIPCLTDWREAMDREGADDMRHVRALFESRPVSKIIPDQSIIFGMNPQDENHILAAGSNDQSFMLIYLAKGQPVDVVMKKSWGKVSVGWWFNPRTGEAEKIGEFENSGIRKFNPPSSGTDHDWLLVIDSKNAKLDVPGQW